MRSSGGVVSPHLRHDPRRHVDSPVARPPASPVAIRPAASLVPLRLGTRGLEVVLLQRHAKAAFLGGAYVFPGGALDEDDASPAWSLRIVGLDAAAANRRLAQADGALAFWVAAVRECFEESGLLFAVDRQG